MSYSNYPDGVHTHDLPDSEIDEVSDEERLEWEADHREDE